MANHGLIVSSDSADEIRRTTDEILGQIADHLGNDWTAASFGQPNLHGEPIELVRRIGPALRGLLANDPGTLKIVTFDDSPVAQALAGTTTGKSAALAGPMTPDQIVYCGSYPLWFVPKDTDDDAALVEQLREAIDDHKQRTRFAPKVVLVEGVGMFAVGDDFKQASTVRDVYLDAVKVMSGATRLGGVSYLSDRERRFIEDWEVESYRRSVSLGSTKRGQLERKVAVVTGAAQGFGLEIARGLVDEAVHLALADVNETGVVNAASELSASRPRRSHCVGDECN